MDFVETACAVALLLRAKVKKRRKKQYWVDPIISERLIKGQFYKIHSDLLGHPNKFFNYYKLSVESFNELLQIVGPKITYQDSKWRKSVPPEERLSVTLRYLGTGTSFNSLHFQYLLGATTIREIVKDTCKQFWKCLQPIYLSEKSEHDWMDIAEQFYNKTDFPNCIGAADCKHVKLKKPSTSGSELYIHKKCFSTILLGVVDANYCFAAIDVGAYGADSDSNVFKNSNFGKSLNNNQLNIPSERKLPNDTGIPMPFVIVGNEAFALSENILRPYPKRNLTTKQKIYNYRLNRARRIVDCTFSMLVKRWRIFDGSIDVEAGFADCIIKACCVLHNFVRNKENVQVEDESFAYLLQSCHSAGTRANTRGLNVRDHFANYFMSPQGSVPHQYDNV